jgi:uncharacterized SAM-binding protein YcdF (DUF218 family)
LSKKIDRKCQKFRFVWLAGVACLLVLVTIIPIRLAIALYQAPDPQAIFTLGSGREREEFTAKFAQKHPHLAIWVSGGIRPDKTREIFQTAGIAPTRLHIDCRAIDTVTNFTSLASDFNSRNFQHLYLITAHFHTNRAKAIAAIVFGSQGIAVTPVPIDTERPNDRHSPESWHKTLRDTVRAILWLLTGHTGASFRSESIASCR